MSRDDGIYWDATAACCNGCKKHGPACKNCWAVNFAWRFAHNPNEKLRARFGGLVENVYMCGPDLRVNDIYRDWTGATTFDLEPLLKLSRVRTPKVVAFSWYGDWMYRPFKGYIDDAIFNMDRQQQHKFLTLTKRPDVLFETLYSPLPNIRFLGTGISKPPQNIWLGVTAWDQESYNRACDYLSVLHGWHTWISLEPLLGPVDITQSDFRPDWIVVGAETGRGAREIEDVCVLRVYKDCQTAGIPCWIKQLSKGSKWVMVKEWGLDNYRQSPFARGEKG